MAEPIGFAMNLICNMRERSQEYLKGFLFMQLEKIEFPLVDLEKRLGGETLGKDQEFVFHTQGCKIAAVTSAREPMKNFKKGMTYQSYILKRSLS